MIAPLIPGLNESEIPGILHAAAQTGCKHANYVLLRLPHGVKALFEQWLSTHEPDKQHRIIDRIQRLRGGKAKLVSLRRTNGR